MRNFNRTLFSLLIVSLLSLSALYAGTTGKIRGIVTDQNGDPLPGANIILQGTYLGASTDKDGVYIILLVPPGKYNIEASMIGYKTSVVKDILVETDRTNTTNFVLEEAIMEGETVVVEAKRDMIKVDVSASETNVKAAEVRDIPFASRVEDLVGMQAGVTGSLQEGKMEIRAGDYYENNVMVDGLSTTDGKSGKTSFPVNQQSIQEVQVLRGGFNAEYGEARSGLVNIVTKDPEDKFHVSVDYRYDPVRNRHQDWGRYDPRNMWPYRLYDGPNADSASYIVLYNGITPDTLKWEGWQAYSDRLNSDADTTNDLSPQEARDLWKWRHRPMDYATVPGHNIDVSVSGGIGFLPWKMNVLAGFKYQSSPFPTTQPQETYNETDYFLKIVNKLSESTNVTLQFMNSYVNTVSQDDAGSKWSNEIKLSYSGGSSEPFYPYRKGWVDRRNTMGALKLLHVFSATRYLEADLSFFGSYWDTDKYPQSPESAGRTYAGTFYYDPQAGYIPRDLGAPDNVSGYRMFGGASSTDDSYSERYRARVSMVDQFHPAHELKTGVDFRYSKLVEDRSHLHDDDPAQLFLWQFNIEPIEISAYVQDKIEFMGMVANIGVRWDYYSLNDERNIPIKSLDYATDADLFYAVKGDSFPTVNPKPQMYFSPRVGIAFPITTNSKVYFNYGHFVQMPQTEAMYSSTLDFNRPRVQWMGEPQLTWQKTANFELGYDQNVFDWFQLHIGAFYRDYTNAQSGIVYAHANQTMIMESAVQRETREIRGLDIELRKTMGRFITGFFNFNVTQKSVSNLEVPGISQIPIITDNPNVGIDGELRGVPLPNTSELTPYGRGVITIGAPANWGPRLWNYPILHKTRASFRISYVGAQLTRHPDGNFRENHPDVKFYTIPRAGLSMRISRSFSVTKTLNMEAYMDISNLWNSFYQYAGVWSVDYYNDLYAHGKTDRVGSDEVSNKLILRSEQQYHNSKQVPSSFVFGLRIML